MAVKPIVRWTTGELHQAGIECLLRSISLWQSIYGNAFDYYVCHNGQPPSGCSGCHLLDQSHYLKTLPFAPVDTLWKLCPPRIDINTHEIMIDNDLLVYAKCPSIDRFLSSNRVIATEGHRRFYGRFEHVVQVDYCVNTGLIGFPPKFDLAAKLRQFCGLYPFKLDGHCDDQGLFTCVARTVLDLIPLEDIWVCNPAVDFAPYRLGKYGTHFAGLNQGHMEYWNRYVTSTARTFSHDLLL